jgi:hypothetical protein
MHLDLKLRKHIFLPCDTARKMSLWKMALNFNSILRRSEALMKATIIILWITANLLLLPWPGRRNSTYFSLVRTLSEQQTSGENGLMANIQIIKVNTFSWLFPNEYILKSLNPITLHSRIALQRQNYVRSSRGLIQYWKNKYELTAVFVGEIKTSKGSVLVLDFKFNQANANIYFTERVKGL